MLTVSKKDSHIGSITSSRGRVVKAMDSKSIGVSPRRFESCRLRNLFFGSALRRIIEAELLLTFDTNYAFVYISDTFDTYIESRLVLMTIWIFLKSVWRNRL